MKILCYIWDVNFNKIAEKWDDQIFVEFIIMKMVIKQKEKYENSLLIILSYLESIVKSYMEVNIKKKLSWKEKEQLLKEMYMSILTGEWVVPKEFVFAGRKTYDLLKIGKKHEKTLRYS
jgi:hypothetical protein